MGKSLKLLVIDDNQELLGALYQFLSEKKYNVVSASDGLDGLKLLEADKQGFDLIITDIVMPNVSGVAIISIVKQKYPGVPVIAITGWGEHPETLAAEAQADLILEKPFDLDELDDVIKDLISRKKKL